MVNIIIKKESADVVLFLFYVSVLVFGFSSYGHPQDRGSDGGAKPNNTSYYSIVDAIRERKNITRFKDSLPPLENIPPMFKARTGEFLVKDMTKEKRLTPKKKQKSSPTEHNLGTISGRSAWVFENLFNVDLLDDKHENKNQSIEIRARKYLNAYRQGLIDASKRQHEPQISISKLVQSFKKNGQVKKTGSSV